MTKSNIVMLLIVVAVVAGIAYVWWGPPNLRLVYYGDLTAAFAGDLHDFVRQNSGRLPTDWQEFERWEVKTHGKKRWGADDTSKRMRILREPYDISSDVPRFIEVTDPDIKGMETYINRFVENARLSVNMTNKTAIGIGTPLAERPSHTTDRTDRVTSGPSFAEATDDKSAAP